MSWLNLSRGAAVFALLCFFMPWFAVSCQQTEIVSATGVQLATGTVPDPNTGGRSTDGGLALWALLALLMLLASAVIGMRYADAKKSLLACCALCGAAALLLAGGMLVSVNSAKRELTASSRSGAQNVDAAMRQLAAQGIRLEVKVGYWLTLFLASGASAAAYFAANGRSLPQWASTERLKSASEAAGASLRAWTPSGLGLSNDQRFWDGLPDKSDPDALEEYLTRFPDGQFAGLAHSRLLRAGREMPTPRAAVPVNGSQPADLGGATEGSKEEDSTEQRSETLAEAVTDADPNSVEQDAACPACSAPIQEGAKFCTGCGLRLMPNLTS